MEETVKQLIKESLYKRLIGHAKIDTIQDNDALIEKWTCSIVSLCYNNCDIELAAQDIYNMNTIFFGKASIEDIRASLFFINYRFPEEITAFSRYLELREEVDSVILFAVKEELKFVEKGDFFLS